MSKQFDIVIKTIGLICLIYWVIDFINNVFFGNGPTWLIWYSSFGLFLTSIALISENKMLIFSMFCALFVPETIWTIDFIYVVLTHGTFLGLTNYAFSESFSKKDFYMTFYHFLIPIGLFIAIIRTPHSYKYGWVGASIFIFTLLLLTYIFIPPSSGVNCLYQTARCKVIFSFLYNVNVYYRMLIALSGLILFIYIPTNFILNKVKN